MNMRILHFQGNITPRTFSIKLFRKKFHNFLGSHFRSKGQNCIHRELLVMLPKDIHHICSTNSTVTSNACWICSTHVRMKLVAHFKNMWHSYSQVPCKFPMGASVVDLLVEHCMYELAYVGWGLDEAVLSQSAMWIVLIQAIYHMLLL